jgi:hypothetical protein
MDWLKEEAFGKSILFYIFLCISTKLIYCVIIVTALKLLNIHISYIAGDIPILSLSFPYILFMSALIEESIFRLPLAALMYLRCPISVVLIAAAALSASFGILHGGLSHVFIQGGAGIFYSVLFLKCGGCQKKYLKPLMTTTIAHFIFNGSLAIATICSGKTTF